MRAKEFTEGILDSITDHFKNRKDFPDHYDPTKVLDRVKAGISFQRTRPKTKRTQRRYDQDVSDTYRIKSWKGVSEHDIEGAKKMVSWLRKQGIGYTISKVAPAAIEEDLGPEQKQVGQLGPTEKVGKQGAVGKLVGS